jgi:SAM-dependent methyltransferase
MLDIITKEEYFGWIDKGYASAERYALKEVQDAFILSMLLKYKNLKIAEVGGGQSRILSNLSQHHECWNIDKLEGDGNGPTRYIRIPKVKLIKCFLGDFSKQLPKNYFDVVFSISVVEHIPPDCLVRFFEDIARILKPGGISMHAIDVYLGDSDYPKINQQIEIYRSISEKGQIPLDFIEKPVIDATTQFKCRYATNSDNVIYRWNKSVPKIQKMRNHCQSVSIKAMWKKNETIKNDIINTDKLKHSDFQKITSTNAEAAKVYLDSERLVSNNTNEELYETLKSKKKLVLVYQMGKVGSASIKTKLKEYDDLAVYHIHRLNKKTNDLMIKMHLNNCNVELALQERKWKEISTFLQSEKPNLYIITAIRDPIARNISAFFQNYDFKQQKESDVSSLVYKFMNEYPHQLPLKWFDEQIKEVFWYRCFKLSI